tara:strand:+ start:430 stop:873 length:444 start_codon:yes stop_codon:yes gene_type:complete
MKTFADFMVELLEEADKPPKKKEPIDATQVRKTARVRSRTMKRRNKKPTTQKIKDRTMKKRKDDSAIGASARNKVLKDIIPGYTEMDPVMKAKKKEQKKDRIDREIKKEIPKVKRAEPARMKKHKENIKTRPERKKAEKEREKNKKP